MQWEEEYVDIGIQLIPRRICQRIWEWNTVDSAFNELGHNEISECLKIHFFKTNFFFNKDIIMKGDKILFFLGPLNFAK